MLFEEPVCYPRKVLNHFGRLPTKGRKVTSLNMSNQRNFYFSSCTGILVAFLAWLSLKIITIFFGNVIGVAISQEQARLKFRALTGNIRPYDESILSIAFFGRLCAGTRQTRGFRRQEAWLDLSITSRKTSAPIGLAVLLT
jgi:hypothetical protein